MKENKKKKNVFIRFLQWFEKANKKVNKKDARQGLCRT